LTHSYLLFLINFLTNIGYHSLTHSYLLFLLIFLTNIKDESTQE